MRTTSNAIARERHPLPHPVQLPRPPLRRAAFTERELWRAVLDEGDVAALRALARGLEPVEDNELGAGD